MPCKVDYKDLEKITKLLDKVCKLTNHPDNMKKHWDNAEKAGILSKMIKDKYTEIKPDYDRTN